jgi:predicted TIM-barrel fold metal-dependent hydrolase
VYDGPIIDAHTHPMLDPESQIVAAPHPPEAYRALVDGSPVSRAAAITIAHGGDLDRTRARNNAVIKLGLDSEFFFFPVCSVHPADGLAALREIDRVADAGAAWLKLHPNTQRFDVAHPAVAKVVRKATECGLPVLFDAYSPWDANQPGKFVNLALALPECKLILAHAHGPGFPALLVYDIVARYPQWHRNVWIDISVTGPMLAGGPFAEQFVWVLRKVGVDRVIFGSDYPLDHPLTAARAVAELGFTDDEQAAILHDNADALLSGKELYIRSGHRWLYLPGGRPPVPPGCAVARHWPVYCCGHRWLYLPGGDPPYPPAALSRGIGRCIAAVTDGCIFRGGDPPYPPAALSRGIGRCIAPATDGRSGGPSVPRRGQVVRFIRAYLR